MDEQQIKLTYNTAYQIINMKRFIPVQDKQCYITTSLINTDYSKSLLANCI